MDVTHFGVTKVDVIGTRYNDNIKWSEETTPSLTLWDSDKQKTSLLW